MAEAWNIPSASEIARYPRSSDGTFSGKRNTPLRIRFWSLVNIVDDATSCWEWKRPTNGKGYGYASFNNNSAHIWAALWCLGPKPQPDYVIDHKCNNPRCVRPDHLRYVPIMVNVLRGVGLCAENARKQVCKRGHPFSGDNLMIHKRGDRVCRKCKSIWAKNTYTRKKEKQHA